MIGCGVLNKDAWRDCGKGPFLVHVLPLRFDKLFTSGAPKPDLGSLTGKPVRSRFSMRHARLYAFWVGPDSSGASYGYVAAGGQAS